MRKFLIFINTNLNEPVIALSNENWHRDIKAPTFMGRFYQIDGGGKWNIDDNGTLTLYDASGDFGVFDECLAKEAFEKKNVWYNDEPAYDSLKLKKLETF